MAGLSQTQSGINKVRTSNLKKATDIRKSGYKSTIHALPSDVRTKLDQLLTWRMSPQKVLAQLCTEFPDVKFPSPKTVENYRNRYHKLTLTKKTTLIAEKEITMDFKKNQIEKSVADQMLKIATEIYPQMVNRVSNALEKEKQIGLPIKAVNEASSALMDVTKLLLDFTGKNNLKLFVQQETTVQAAQSEANKEDVYTKLARILNRRGHITSFADRNMVQKTN
mgnify:CR=1 FL=1